MTITFRIRSYGADDEAALVACWNAALWADPIDARTWRARFLLDPQFETATCLVAERDGEVIGFYFGLRQPETGDAVIVAFGVVLSARRQGIGSELLREVLDVWRRAGVERVLVGPYVPTYIAPGVDETAYPEAMAFLQRRGFVVDSRPISMRAMVAGYRSTAKVEAKAITLEAAGINVRPAMANDILPLRSFLREHFPEWQGEVGEVLADLFVSDSGRCVFLVAERGSQIVGFAQARAERFGPFGVDAALRGQGVGAVLLDRTLLAMRGRGYHVTWFLWTDERAARLYRQFGFEEARRFALFSSRLSGLESDINPDRS